MITGDTLAGIAGRLMASAGGAAVDTVAVTRQGSPAFSASVRPIDVYVTREAILMEHPLEDGSVIADHIVHKPIDITIECLVIGDYRSAYAEIADLFQQGAILEVATKAQVYPSVVICEMPHGEDAEHFDALSMSIRLKEAKFVSPETSEGDGGANDQLDSAADSSSKPTTQRGQQSGSTSNRTTNAAATSSAKQATSGSTLYRWTYGN